jgi:hypothetical protein
MSRRPTTPRSRPSSDKNDDPTVREVRAVRRRMLRQAGGTVEGYFRLMDDMAKARASSSSKRRSARSTSDTKGRRGKAA